MDNLTHGLVGAAIAKAGGERVTPLATATLVVAANAPDIDVLSYFGGEFFALSVRRGITHGWPAMIVLPFLVAGAMLAWDRFVRRRRSPGATPARPRPLLAVAVVGVATHPALDWMNTYGMRWGLPFDASWSYGDALFIIDPWVWLVLGGGIFIASRPGRWGTLGWTTLAVVTSLIVVLVALPRAVAVVWFCGVAATVVARLVVGRGPGGGLAVRAAVGVLVLYIGVMVGSDLLARAQVAEAARTVGLEVRDLMVAPLPADPFGADVEVLTDLGYVPGDFRWTRAPRVRLHPSRIVPFVQAPPGMTTETVQAVLDVARADPDAMRYLVWSRYPYERIEPKGDGWSVSFADARYDGAPGAGSLAGPTVTVLSDDLR